MNFVSKCAFLIIIWKTREIVVTCDVVKFFKWSSNFSFTNNAHTMKLRMHLIADCVFKKRF